MINTYPLNERLELARKLLSEVKGGHFELREKAGAYSLSLKGNKTFEHINCLRRLPLIQLDLSNTMVMDLSPLENMALKELDLRGTRVVVIKSLNLSRLEKINLHKTLVSNLSFLRASPIKYLKLNDVWMDLTVLKTCRELELIEVPRELYSQEYLDKLQLTAKIIRF